MQYLLKYKSIKTDLLLSLVMFFILLGFNSFAQESSKINPDGYNKFYYKSGKLASEGTMRAGKPDGYWKNYHKTGGLKSEGNRKNYLLDSVWKFYDEQEKLSLEITYKAGKKNGFRYTYQGEETTKEYFENDLKQNYSYVLYANGKVKIKTPFIDGLEIGKAIEYDSSGNIIQLIIYKKGYVVERERINRYDTKNMPHGKWKWFFDDEEILQSEGSFNHGLKNGYFKEYDRDGNLLSAKKFVNGEEIEKAEELVKLDIRRDYYPNGKPKVVATSTKMVFPKGFAENTILMEKLYGLMFSEKEKLLKKALLPMPVKKKEIGKSIIRMPNSRPLDIIEMTTNKANGNTIIQMDNWNKLENL